MVNRNSGSTTGRIAKRTILALALSGLLALGGCSSSTPPPGQVAAMEKTELHFSLDQCQPLDANLFKCPLPTSQFAIPITMARSNVSESDRKAASSYRMESSLSLGL
jgi:hypothetical protein